MITFFQFHAIYNINVLFTSGGMESCYIGNSKYLKSALQFLIQMDDTIYTCFHVADYFCNEVIFLKALIGLIFLTPVLYYKIYAV